MSPTASTRLGPLHPTTTLPTTEGNQGKTRTAEAEVVDVQRVDEEQSLIWLVGTAQWAGVS